MGAIGSAARIVHVLLLAVWLGSGVGLAAFTTPVAFDLMPSRDLAGNLVGVVLTRLDTATLVGGPIILLSLWAGWLPLGFPVRLRSILVFLMTAASAISGRLLTPRMVELRQTMGRRIDEIPLDSPARVAFGDLHTYSTALLALQLGLAAVLIVSAVLAATPKPRHGIQL